MQLSKHERQILAILNKIKRGKVKNVTAAVNKIRDIKRLQSWAELGEIFGAVRKNIIILHYDFATR